MRVARKNVSISQHRIIAVDLRRGLRADQRNRVKNIVWFTAHGPMVPDGEACTTFW